MMFDLNEKVAVVIGGGGHLCSAMADGLAKAGAKIAILDIRPHNASKEYPSFYVDVVKKISIEAALSQVLQRYDKVDIVINGAGINDPSPFLDITLDKWDAVMDSQITGTMLGCQVFGKHMLENGGGSIINISSASAGPPLSKAFAYSVAKAGIKNLTQNLAREWATSGIRVNAIRPGFFPTEWNRKNFITPERHEDIIRHTPMKRYGKPEELVGCAVWLASDLASFVTGAEIAVDGGYSCMTI